MKVMPRVQCKGEDCSYYRHERRNITHQSNWILQACKCVDSSKFYKKVFKMHMEATRTLYVNIKSKSHILVREEASKCMPIPEDPPHMPTQLLGTSCRIMVS